MSSDKEKIALAERCEAATGPDRELDRDIMLQAVPCDRAPFRYWAPMNENTGHGTVDIERVYYAPHCARAVAVPTFTASLHAAMTLVPEGLRWAVDTLSGASEATVATIDDKTGYYVGDESTAFAATPALALTAACLRALASQVQS